MRNLIVASIFGGLTSACTQAPSTCDVFTNKNGAVNKAVFNSPDGTPTQYTESLSKTSQGVWVGAATDKNGKPLTALFTVDTNTGQCIVTSSRRTDVAIITENLGITGP